MTTTTPVDADTGEVPDRPFAASHTELSDRLHELLLLGYVIDRPEDVLRMAVSEVVDEIRDGWDGPLFVGRPQ